MKHQLLLITSGIVLATIGVSIGCNRSQNGADVSSPEGNVKLNAAEVRRMIYEQAKTTNDYYYVFDKLLPLTDRTAEIINCLLDSSFEHDNRITIYLLNGIIERCGAEAEVLVPHIKNCLSSTSVCVQLAALRSLHSIGNLAWPTADAVGTCLNSPNAFIRANAAETLSMFGEKADVYLPRLKTLFETETNNIVRNSYQKAIDCLEKEQ